MIEDQIAEAMCNFSYCHQPISKGFKKNLKKNLIKKIKDKSNYLSFEIENGIVKKLIFAEFSNAPVLYDRISIPCLLWGEDDFTPAKLKKEIEKIRSFFKNNNLRVSLSIPVQQKKMISALKKLDFYNKGTYLKGNVSVALRVLGNLPPLPENYKLDTLDYEKEIDELMRLEYLAHKNEPSSIIHQMKKKDYEGFKIFLKELAAKKNIFTLKYKNKIVGTVSFNIKKELHSIPMISHISICPKFKGKGLGKYLYLMAFREMKKRKKDVYYGFSSTDQVLKFSKTLKRSPIYYQLVLD